MLRLLLPLGLLISTWPFTELFEIQADSFNFTETDPQFKVRERRQVILTNGPGVIDPHCGTCGVSGAATLQARVINGVPVRPRWKYPWAVPTTIFGNKRFSCGGALITKEFVLTAAHCIRHPRFLSSQHCIHRGRVVSCFLEPKDIKVAIMGESHNRPIALLKLSQIYLHPQYDFWNDLNDIALLKLARPLNKCNRYIAPICLPTRPMSKRGQQVVVAGWGRALQNSSANEGAQLFREGRVMEVDPSYCQKSHNQERRKEKIYCTVGATSFNQSSCQGDSGTSVFSNFYGIFYSLGVTSVHTDGEKCPIDGYVSFANTYGYMEFITSIVGKDLPVPPSADKAPRYGR